MTCTDFILPTLKNGKYYTATGGPHGLGNQLNEGTTITPIKLFTFIMNGPILQNAAMKLFSK